MDSNLEKIDGIFQSMKSAGWNTEKDLIWGFFFTAAAREPLAALLDELLPYKYSLESFEQRENGRWVLQLAKREPLSSGELHSRNLSFNDLAERHAVEYDGWDVSRTGGNQD